MCSLSVVVVCETRMYRDKTITRFSPENSVIHLVNSILMRYTNQLYLSIYMYLCLYFLLDTFDDEIRITFRTFGVKLWRGAWFKLYKDVRQKRGEIEVRSQMQFAFDFRKKPDTLSTSEVWTTRFLFQSICSPSGKFGWDPFSSAGDGRWRTSTSHRSEDWCKLPNVSRAWRSQFLCGFHLLV